MAQAPSLDFEEFVARKRGEGPAAAETAMTQGREYAYVSDRRTRAAFERMKPVELAVSSSVRLFKEFGTGDLLGSAVKVSERQFPRIEALSRHCANTLGIAPPTVFIVNNPTYNAATYGTNETSFIMLHSALVDNYTDEELITVIGHECGHIHNSHVVYLTTLYFLTHMAGVFVRWAVQPALIALRAWSRRAEITCDRAGMLCSKDEDISMRAMTKLAVGSRKLYEEFNLEAFLDQHREGQASVGKYMEVFASHPYLPKRIFAMRAFAQSEMFRKAAKLGQDGITIDEVDNRVLALLKGDA